MSERKGYDMKSLLVSFLCLAAAMEATAGAHDVLVARGSHFVERFTVSDAGE